MIFRSIFRFESLALAVSLILFAVLGKLAFHFWGGDLEGQYDHRVTRWLMMIFAAAFVYNVARNLDEELKINGKLFSLRLFAEVFISGIISWYIYKTGSGIFVDDSGFILRYLDNFKDGYFFCFNPGEGPIFGLSGFLFGVVAGLPVMAGLLSPEQSLFFFSYLGLFLAVFLFIRIVAEITGSKAAVVPLVCLAVFGGRNFLASANSGMEMNFHIAVILAAMLAFLKNNHKWFWLFSALAVISKLDAVPVIFILVAGFIVRNFSTYFPPGLNNKSIRYALLWGALPLVAWVLFTWLIFGSPLPQSAYAKVYFHQHPGGSWFPFLDYFTTRAGVSTLFYGMLYLLPVQVLITLAAKRKIQIKEYLFFLCFVASMFLYYLYNPQEAMVWYYAFPEMMVLGQIALSLYFIIEKIHTRLPELFAPFSAGLVLMAASPALMKDVMWFNRYQMNVEGERMHIGDYVAAHVAQGDTLLSGHGFPSRPSKGFVIDNSGLNSKIALPYNLDWGKVIRHFHPRWMVNHGIRSFINDIAFSEGYVIDTSFYEVTYYNYPAWRMFRKPRGNENGLKLWILEDSFIQGEEITRNNENECNRIIFKKLVVSFPGKFKDSAFYMMCIHRKLDAFKLHFNDYSGDSLIATSEITVPKIENDNTKTFEVRFPILPDPPGENKRRLEIWPDEAVGKAEGVDPALLFKFR